MADPLPAVAEPLLSRLSTWNARSWGHRTAAGATRAEVAAVAVQRIADLAADAEGQPRRTVPRLPGQTGAGLADQLAVLVADLARTPDPGRRDEGALALRELAAALRG